MTDSSEAIEFRVWHTPQVPGKPFEYTVPDLDAGIMLCEALALYDLFQFENRIKPDYCNAGGVSYRHPVATDGEWWDIDTENEDEVAEVREIIAEVQS